MELKFKNKHYFNLISTIWKVPVNEECLYIYEESVKEGMEGVFVRILIENGSNVCVPYFLWICAI